MKLYTPCLGIILLLAACREKEPQPIPQPPPLPSNTQQAVVILNDNNPKIFTFTENLPDTSWQLQADVFDVVYLNDSMIRIPFNNSIDSGTLKYTTAFSNDSVVTYYHMVMKPTKTAGYMASVYPSLYIRYNLNTKTVTLSEQWAYDGPMGALYEYAITYSTK